MSVWSVSTATIDRPASGSILPGAAQFGRHLYKLPRQDGRAWLRRSG
jgi:hypothetical protein